MSNLISRYQKIRKQIRRRARAFWDKFSIAELEAIAKGDPIPTGKFEMLNGYLITNLEFAVLPRELQAELAHIEKLIEENPDDIAKVEKLISLKPYD